MIRNFSSFHQNRSSSIGLCYPQCSHALYWHKFISGGLAEAISAILQPYKIIERGTDIKRLFFLHLKRHITSIPPYAYLWQFLFEM